MIHSTSIVVSTMIKTSVNNIMCMSPCKLFFVLISTQLNDDLYAIQCKNKRAGENLSNMTLYRNNKSQYK
jgi:hypothetical protein